MGLKINDLDQTFMALIEGLAEAAIANSDAFVRGHESVWTLPKEFQADPVTADASKIREGFGRTELHRLWAQAWDKEDPGVFADVLMLTRQIDYLRCAERAYRTRHLTQCRALAHSMARLKRHGESQGLFMAHHKRAIKSVLEAAQSQ